VIGGGLRALIAGVERAIGRGALPPAEVRNAEAAVAAGIRAIETPEAAPVPTLPPPVAPPAEAMRLVGLPETELRAHVRSVGDELLAARAGSRADGAWRPDLGAITIEWGDERAGLAHILAARAAQGIDGERWIRATLLEVLLDGVPINLRGPAGAQRIDLVWQGHSAVLALHRHGVRENWILTGFPLRKSGPDGTGGLNPPPPYAPRPTGTGATEGTRPQLDKLPEAPRRFNAYTPTGRAVLLEPKVVELDRIIVSHDAEGRPNPAYPHKEGVQPRERGAAPSQAQVRAIASGLIPERLLPNVEASTGPPIVSADLVAETGNGRVAALALVYRQPELAAQREAYLATLRRAGYDLSGFREPVLVAERVSALSPAERAAFVREANKPVVAAETVVEQSRNDAAAVAAALARWRGGDVEAAANRDFVRAFVEGLTVGERSGLLDSKGGPTPALTDRIERALMQAAYGDALAPVLERLWLGKDEGMRGLAAALRQVAGDWAALRADVAAGRVPAEYDVTPALAEAVEAIAEAHARKIKLAELVEQVDIERPAMTAPARAMLSAWFPEGDLARRIKGQDKVAEVLRGYVERARLADPGPGLFSLPPPKPDDTLAAVARATGDAPQRAEPQAARLLAADDEARRLAALPETERAELFEARRILADRDVALVVDDAGTTVSARALLDQAEREIEEASAAAVCLIGSVAA